MTKSGLETKVEFLKRKSLKKDKEVMGLISTLEKVKKRLATVQSDVSDLKKPKKSPI